MNFDAILKESAINYMEERDLQLRRFGYYLKEIEEYECGIRAIFRKWTGETFQSIYILEQYRGQGKYKTLLLDGMKVLTSYECGIETYLQRNDIEYQIEDLCRIGGYDIIAEHYGDQTTKRTGVRLMNHIDEGLIILDSLGVDDYTKSAYCIHPIVQSDEALKEFWENGDRYIDPVDMMLAMEYRSVANEYLSTREIEDISEIRLSPLEEVNNMLRADKIQNYKDFMKYHYGTHERSAELQVYFKNWFKRLGITDTYYRKILSKLENI